MINSFLSIIKWKKLTHIVIIQFLFKYCFLCGYGFKTKLSFVDLGILSLSTITILASGYLYGYYLKFNNNRVIFSTKHAKYLSYFFAVISIILGTYLSFYIQKPFYTIIQILALTLVILFFKFIRTKTFFNNLAEGGLKVLSILIVLWFDYPIELTQEQANTFFYLQIITIFYAIYSFLGNIVREIIKDIITINEDYIKKHKTLPIVLGRKRAKNVILTISIIILFSTVAFGILLVNDTFILSIIFLFGTIPQLWFINDFLKTNTALEFKKIMKITNTVYILAVLSVPIIAIYFKYVI